MENKSLFETINSKYIRQRIFDFIKDENFKFKLFIHSKLYQKQFELEMIDFKERYITQTKINIDSYLLCYNLFNTDPKHFDKTILNTKLQEDLVKNNLNIDIIHEYLINDLKKLSKKLTEKENEKELNKFIYFKKEINIFSPFFDFLINSEYFDLFTIPISVKLIEKFNLKNDYISAFEKLNKLNSKKYPSLLFDYKDSNDINYLKEFKIKFHKIKRLIMSHDYSIYIDNYDYFFKTLFSFNNIEKNLIHLNLYVGFIRKDLIDPNSLKNLNSLCSLEVLELKGFKFKTTFTLKLKNLKKLHLKGCDNLTFEENSCLNMKILYLLDCSIGRPKSLLKFPELEDCLLQKDLRIKQKYNLIIDFKSLEKVKNLTAEIGDFIAIENTVLENVSLYSYKSSEETEKIMLEKLISIKTLKNINLELKEIGDYQIANIPGENTSVVNMYIKWQNNYQDCILNNLQKKFPFATGMGLLTQYKKIQKFLEIQENPNCKINRLSLKIGGNKNILLDCQSFENLISIDFFVDGDIINIIDCFPLFNDKCKVKFKSLVYFKFSNYSNEINYNFFKNIYNNFDCMPNIKSFDFHGITKEITEDFYKKFINKILVLNLDYIYFTIKRNSNNDSIGKYKDEELKEMFPDIKYIKFDKINITKFN